MQIYNPSSRPASPVAMDVAGRTFGFLTTEYRRDRDIACRCVCDKLVHVAAEALADGTVTSCGCQPASPAFHNQMRALVAQHRREVTFSIARRRA